MTRKHRQLMAIVQKRGLSASAWKMLCLLKNIYGIEYAIKAAQNWPAMKEEVG